MIVKHDNYVHIFPSSSCTTIYYIIIFTSLYKIPIDLSFHHKLFGAMCTVSSAWNRKGSPENLFQVKIWHRKVNLII